MYSVVLQVFTASASFFLNAAYSTLSCQHVHSQPDHQVLVPGVRFRRQERQGGQADVVDDSFSGRQEQPAVAIQEINKQHGPDALIAIGEWMVLDDEIQQMGGLGLDAGIGRLAENALLQDAQNSR